ncbi:MAG: DUF436 family protein [Dysosmobacter sp.]
MLRASEPGFDRGAEASPAGDRQCGASQGETLLYRITAAYKAFRHPVALEEIRADAGLDIGGTSIGIL